MSKTETFSEFGEQKQFVLRSLEIDDFDKGFISLLGQLTTVGSVTKADFEETFASHQNAGDVYNLIVIEDTLKKKIVGAATLVLERKFIHGCGKVAHVEDVVVDKTCRGQKLGKRLVDTLNKLAISFGCYKIILDCDEKNESFYNKCGFEKKALQMANYLPLEPAECEKADPAPFHQYGSAPFHQRGSEFPFHQYGSRPL